MAMEPPAPNAVSRGESKQQMPPKFSRYRSVRQAAANRQAHEQPPPPPAVNPAIARSMSRYRRNNKPTTSSQSSQPLPPLPTQALPRYASGNNKDVQEEDDAEGAHAGRSGGRSGKASRDVSIRSGNNAPYDPPTMEARVLDLAISSPTKASGTYKDGGRRDYSSGGEQCGFYSDEEREEAQANRKPRARPSNSALKGKRAGHGQKETEKSIPEMPQNNRGEERHAKESSSAEKHVLSQFSKSTTLKEKLTLGSRGGKGDRAHLKKMISSPTLVDQEEGNASSSARPAPAVDPSARKVHIQYNGFSISMPVTTTTTPKDVLCYAAEHLSDDVDPNTSFLMESFSQLELERPIRMYEHVHEIMNSWDSDGQNYLVVSLTRDGGPESIQVGGAPSERPEESSFHLYHSSRPGKWSKRWITLRTDGQVVLCKKLGIEPSNICHLSDYDIYTPTPYQVSKKIKPPKKICFAMKSQQKSNLFLSTENFVHYVCSNDATTIDALYKAMQEWRSWYLGYTLGKIQIQSKPVSRVDRSRSSKASTPRDSLRQSLSGESASNHPANFKPLVDLNHYAQDNSNPGSRRNSQRSSSREHGGGFSRRTSKRGRGPPPASRNASRLSDEPDSSSLNNGGALVEGVSPEEIEKATFAPTGLLGRTYSQRQKAQREREQAMAKELEFDGPFSPTGLLSNPGKNSAPASTQAPANLPGMPGHQPLVDLTPVYKEPIHHQRKGRGVQVEPGKQLVDVATGRELPPGAIVVPSATTTNRPRQGTLLESSPPPAARDFSSFNPSNGNNPSNGGNLSRSNTTRTSRHQNPREQEFSPPPIPTSAGPSSPEGPFSPNGLLARSGTIARAQGAAGGGRGVATGDRNGIGRPLVDLSEQSEFSQGSLLRQVEEWNDGNGIPEPVIDRGRGRGG